MMTEDAIRQLARRTRAYVASQERTVKTKVEKQVVSDEVKVYDITQIEDDEGAVFRPHVAPDVDAGDGDEYEDGQSAALAARLGSFSRNESNRYRVDLPDGEYAAEQFPGVSFLIQGGEIVEITGMTRDAFDAVMALSDTGGTSDKTPREVKGYPERTAPVRLGNMHLMSPEASGLREPGVYVAVEPADRIGGVPVRKSKGLWNSVFRMGSTSENGR